MDTTHGFFFIYILIHYILFSNSPLHPVRTASIANCEVLQMVRPDSCRFHYGQTLHYGQVLHYGQALLPKSL